MPIDRIVGLRISGIKSHRRVRGDFTTGRKAQHANALRIEVPLFRPAAHQTQHPLGIFQGVDIDLVSRTRLPGQTVLQHEGCYATIGQPLGDRVPFVVDRQILMPTAGQYDDCRPVRRFFRWQVRRDRWMMDAGNPPHAAGFSDFLRAV